MSSILRLSHLVVLVCLLAFMLGSVGCAGIIPANARQKIDQASDKYSQAAGITPIQTVTLLSKWYADYQAAKALNQPVVTTATK